jgi:lysophospholipase L1-like esterase
MKKKFLLFILVITCSNCAKKPMSIVIYDSVSYMSPNKSDTISHIRKDTISYLALGDSYTIGQSVTQNESFPYQLYNSLNLYYSNNIPQYCSAPTILATTGWTTDNLIDAVAQQGLASKRFSFVTLLIGVNDQFQNLSIDNYQIKFQEVLNTAISIAKSNPKNVFVLSIPDYGVTPFANGRDNIIGPEIDKFNAINLQISNKAGVHYLNITDISREAALYPNLIANDGLHPSAIQYQLWVSQLMPIVANQFKK